MEGMLAGTGSTGDTQVLMSMNGKLSEMRQYPDLSMDTDFPSGMVERRIISYFFEGIKRKLYDCTSMRFGRESREGDAFKQNIRDIVRSIRRTCYEMVDDHLRTFEAKNLKAEEVVEIIRYVLPEDQAGGAFYRQLTELVEFVYGRDSQKALVFMKSQIRDYISYRLARILTDYEREWQGAVTHLLSQPETQDREG